MHVEACGTSFVLDDVGADKIMRVNDMQMKLKSQFISFGGTIGAIEGAPRKIL